MHLTPAAARNSLAARLVSHFRPLNVFAIRLETENAATSPFAQGFHRLATAQLHFSGSEMAVSVSDLLEPWPETGKATR
jgi:hypothetical protein